MNESILQNGIDEVLEFIAKNGGVSSEFCIGLADEAAVKFGGEFLIMPWPSDREVSLNIQYYNAQSEPVAATLRDWLHATHGLLKEGSAGDGEHTHVFFYRCLFSDTESNSISHFTHKKPR